MRWCFVVVLAVACGKAPPKSDRPKPDAGAPARAQLLPPLARFDTHLTTFHPLHDQPAHAVEVHQYCAKVSADLAHCLIFDGPDAQARLIGIEYVISDKMYAALPMADRAQWHPHNYEVLSGQLAAPGLTPAAEAPVVKDRLNTYGKAWHLWPRAGGKFAGDALPVGAPELAWSSNADGELAPDLVAVRDERLGLDTGARRAARQDLASQARPLFGVDALAPAFKDRSKPPGVVAAQEPVVVDRPRTRSGRRWPYR